MLQTQPTQVSRNNADGESHQRELVDCSDPT
jgi:hypothetical protein